jgi:CotH kinase protein/Lamin Tail Domain/Chitobiase/beta-hexosaminidase C-terminal domain
VWSFDASSPGNRVSDWTANGVVAKATSVRLSTLLSAEAAALRWFVPTNDSLGTTWRSAGFSDGAWTSAVGPLAYQPTADFTTVLAVDFGMRGNAASIAQAGFQHYVIGGTAGTGISTATTRTFGAYSVTLSSVGAALYDDRLRALPTNSGTFTQQDLLRDFVFSRGVTTSTGLDVAVDGLTPNASYRFTVWSFDASSPGNRVSDWTANGVVAKAAYTFNGSTLPTTDTQYQFTFDSVATAGGQVVLAARWNPATATPTTNPAIFINALTVSQATTPALAVAMKNINSTLYARKNFTIADPAVVTQLRLKLRYDDGVAAWINGQEVTLKNAPASPSWNSAALGSHPAQGPGAEEVVLIDIPPGLLLAGTNVLALQVLNVAAGDDDFFLGAAIEDVRSLPGVPSWLTPPTPGVANPVGATGMVRDVHFTVDRGFYTAPFSVGLSCGTLDAQLRYTTDGSAPTSSTGLPYTTPLTISGTMVLRVAAFKTGWLPSLTDTQSYIFPVQMAQQPAAPAGWPATWGINSQVNTNDGVRDGTIPADYGMDQRVVTTTAPGFGIPEALQSLPTISLALAPGDFLGANGIYQNSLSAGPTWERDGSVELVDPILAEKGFHELCRIEAHGNSSRNPYRMQKHSLRLSFKGGDGASKLRYKIFPGSNFNSLNKLILRATFTDGWGLVSWNSNRYRPDDSTMTRDVWVRRSWEAMGNLSPKSRFVHVVINGLYWGVYDASEHIDDDFASDNLGGLPTDWEVVSDFVDPDVSATSPWKLMFSAAAADLSVQVNYETLLQWLDPVNFADYYLLHQYAECEDWPGHNGAAFRNRAVPGARYKWLAWDQEIALEQVGAANDHGVDRISPGATNTTTARTPGPLWNALRNNKEWRLLVADRAHALMNNGGPLSSVASIQRWRTINEKLDKAIVAESARWGDTATQTPYGGDDLVAIGGGTAAELLARKRSRLGVPLKDPYLRDPDWLGAVNYVANTWIPSLHDRANSFATITRLKNLALPLWPATEPPSFAQHGGVVAAGYDLGVTTQTAGAAIYYTTNGTDPRVSVTGAAAGTLYTGLIDLTTTATLKARAVTGTPGSGTEVWSAVTQADFIVGTAASHNTLVISEIHVNPLGVGELEFIELMNISPTETIDLSGVRFTAGIAYTFPLGVLLGPGQRLVMTGAQFTGKLDNNGENLALISATGADIQRFAYDKADPWPGGINTGRSLVLIAPHTNPDPSLAIHWRTSLLPGGSPGTSDGLPFTGDPQADLDGDGLTALMEYALGTSDAVPGAPLAPVLTYAWDTHFVTGEAIRYLTVSFTRAPGTDAADLRVEVSTVLNGWTSARLIHREANGAETWRVPVPIEEAQRQFIRWKVVGF